MPSLNLDDQQLQALWAETCSELTAQVSSLSVDAWGKTCQLHSIDDFGGDKWLATFFSPSSFTALQFEKTLSLPAKQLLSTKLGRPVEIKFIFNLPSATNQPSPVAPTVSTLQAESASSLAPRAASQASVSSPAASHAPSDFGDGLFSASTVRATVISRAATVAKNIGLRPDFTFDTFAVSTSNEMAHVAARSVASNPGISYNPLFLYGGVGVGKTHLMQSIGNYVLAHSPETRIIYCTGEEFTNSIIKAIQTKQALSFKDKYRTCEVLLIDDIQFIAGKNAVQEEFFHTFNALVKQNHQIVLTSDRPPHDIALLEDRLRSRFEAGLTIDIQQPPFELRSAILLAKAAAAGLDLPIDLAQMIAARIDSARQLEGLVLRLKSAVQLQHRLIDQELVTSLLTDHERQEYSTRTLQPHQIISATATHYHLKQSALTGTRRQKEIALARHVAMFLLKSLLEMSYAEIGKLFSHRDHTSVMHAVTKINDTMKHDTTLAQDISHIRASLSR